jgi:protein-L-isoaspartate(D-aspartate) O-methyltransferase
MREARIMVQDWVLGVPCRRGVLALLAVLAAPWGGAGAAEDPAIVEARAEMVRVIERHASYYAGPASAQGLDPRVLQVMGRVPRHDFVPASRRSLAYADRPLPIGYGQTISQPFIVALMTDLLAPEPDHLVLEIGTGSGYQAAVLAPLVKRVCTLEIIEPLAIAAAGRLKALGNGNVEVRAGDGYYGWPECGPFDGIVVTAAATHVPPPLVRQLKPGGRLVIPVGQAFAVQQLVMVQKDADGQVTTRQLLPVRFVPLTRQPR